MRREIQATSKVLVYIRIPIQSIADGGTLFRGTSVATKLVSAYCKEKGMSYLKDVLRPLLQLVCVEEVSVEV